MGLAEKIKTLRETLRMSQREFAEELGITQVVISGYESGKRKPSYDTLMAIDALAKKYKVKIQLLRN